MYLKLGAQERSMNSDKKYELALFKDQKQQ